MDELNKVPEVGDTFENSGYKFTVETVDGMRVDTAVVEKLEQESETESGEE
jgi:CBS domain containing-hemolysin-like protein